MPIVKHEEPESNNGEHEEKSKDAVSELSLISILFKAVLQKPDKKLFDANSPIYKRGDPTQAGELGKAVKVNENVSPNIDDLMLLLFRNCRKNKRKFTMKDSRTMLSINMHPI